MLILNNFLKFADDYTKKKINKDDLNNNSSGFSSGSDELEDERPAGNYRNSSNDKSSKSEINIQKLIKQRRQSSQPNVTCNQM